MKAFSAGRWVCSVALPALRACDSFLTYTSNGITALIIESRGLSMHAMSRAAELATVIRAVEPEWR
jgi:hypothetical protein